MLHSVQRRRFVSARSISSSPRPFITALTAAAAADHFRQALAIATTLIPSLVIDSETIEPYRRLAHLAEGRRFGSSGLPASGLGAERQAVLGCDHPVSLVRSQV